MKQKGFTLIELLVVIVIIGILATISVATFSGYFAKARDSERQAGVRNTATLLKTARAVESITTFVFADTAALNDALRAEGGYTVPAASQGYTYAYFANADQFAVAVCSEENAGSAFVDGTAFAVAAVNGALATVCDDTDATDDAITIDITDDSTANAAAITPIAAS